MEGTVVQKFKLSIRRRPPRTFTRLSFFSCALPQHLLRGEGPSCGMGITGLLPLLKPVTKDVHIRELKGLVSFDTSGGGTSYRWPAAA